jgi:hypothetical protein
VDRLLDNRATSDGASGPINPTIVVFGIGDNNICVRQGASTDSLQMVSCVGLEGGYETSGLYWFRREP